MRRKKIFTEAKLQLYASAAYACQNRSEISWGEGCQETEIDLDTLGLSYTTYSEQTPLSRFYKARDNLGSQEIALRYLACAPNLQLEDKYGCNVLVFEEKNILKVYYYVSQVLEKIKL
jgi:hypothetical protein